MKPFDAFQLYNAIKLHFTSDSYDAVKYGYKTSATERSFWKRKDKYFFAKLAKRFNDGQDLINYYVSFFVDGKPWVGDMLADEAPYKAWVKKFESLGYLFEQDLNLLEERYDSFDKLFNLDGKTYPPIIAEYLSGDINLETVVVFEQMFRFVDRLDKNIVDPIVWPEIRDRIKRYTPFVKVDQKRMKKIALKVFSK